MRAARNSPLPGVCLLLPRLPQRIQQSRRARTKFLYYALAGLGWIGMDFGLLLLVVVLIAIGTPIGVVVALSRTRHTEQQLSDAARAISRLGAQIDQLRAELETLRPQATKNGKRTDELPQDRREAAAVPKVAEPTQTSRSAVRSEEVRHAERSPSSPVIREFRISGLEDALTSRWLVWLGAVAIALSGAFFVKYAIDHQLLGPTARVSIGALLGLTLAIGGEFLRQTPLQRAIASIRPNYVPPALASSGLFMMFVSFYAAYAVYGLLNPFVAFACLAFVALLAVALSLWHGPFVALLGLVGVFLSPALVATPHPSVWALFSYLWVAELACLLVVRYRAWWWLAFAALAAAAIWPLLWLAGGHWSALDALPVGLYLVLSAASFFLLPSGLEASEPRERFLDEIRNLALPEKVVWIAGGVVAAILVIVVRAAGHSTTSLVLFGIAVALYLSVGRRDQSVEGLAIISAVATLAVVAIMPLPKGFAVLPPLAYPPLLPPELYPFAATCAVFGVAFAVGGFVALWGARRPGIWAGASAAMPVLLLVDAYWRIADLDASIPWAAGALALAAVSLFACERVERYRTIRGLDVSLGMYAAGVVALVSLAAAMTLRLAWLTVALSVQVPALAWIRQRIPVRALDVIAGTIAGTVLVRLILNYNVLTYPITEGSFFNWILYGYGVPAIAFYAAARWFRAANVLRLATVTEAGALVFSVLLVSLQIRLLITGNLDSLRYPFLEQSLQSIAWLAIGAGLAILGEAEGNPIPVYGSRILLGLGAAQIVLLQLILSNPLFSGEPVAGPPLLDALFLAYAMPAAFSFPVAAAIRKRGAGHLAHFAGGGGYLLAFVYLSLEVRRFFHGATLTSPGFPDAEMYCYSVIWLAYAAVLLGLGMFLRQSTIRYASLVVLALTSLKVFLFDMSGLTGLYRATSFLGLGLSLVAIGYLYQRFILPRPTESTAAGDPA